MIVLNICICIITLIVGYNLKNYFTGFSKFDKKILVWLFFFHLIVGLGFHLYLTANGGDPILYWESPKTLSINQVLDVIKSGSATGIMYLINYLPSNVFDLSFFTGNLIYSQLGYLGFIYLYKIFQSLFGGVEGLYGIKILNIQIFPYILFLPNMHFWCSGIAKDTLVFFAIVLFIYSFLKLRKRKWGILLSLLILMAIRPHIMLYLLLGFGLGYFLDVKMKGYQRIVIILVFITGFISIFEYVLEFVQIENLELATIEEYTTRKSTKLSRDSIGSSLDISSYSYPYKVFTFLYRPLFFDVSGVLAIIASVENSLLLYLTFLAIISKPIKGFKLAPYIVKGVFFYFLAGALTFPLILGNLGIMLRQKNMFIPFFILFCFWIIWNNSKRRNYITT